MMKRIVILSSVAIAALAAGARAEPAKLAQLDVTVELDPEWRVGTQQDSGTTVDLISGDGISIELLTRDTGMGCDDYLVDGDRTGWAAVTAAASLPGGFAPTSYVRTNGGRTQVDACADEPGGNLIVALDGDGTLDGARGDAVRAVLELVEQAVRAQGNPYECVSGGGYQFWLPKRRWSVATAEHGADHLDAVARLEPAHPFIRVIYSVDPHAGCEDREIDGMEHADQFHSWAVEHAWSSHENGETTVMACGKIAGSQRVAIFQVLVEGSMDDLADSDTSEVVTNIFEGMLNEYETGGGCRGDPTKFAPVSHRSHARASEPAPAPAPDPAPTPPAPTTTDAPAPTEVAAATPPPTDDTGASAATPPAPSDTSTEASYDDDEPRKTRPTLQLAIAHSAASGPTGASASGAAAEIEVIDYGDQNGFATAKEVALGLGWTAGVDFDARAGYGLAYRLGPLSLAATAGLGVDGIGTIDTGSEIHDAGVLAYLGGRARLAAGSVILDGSVSLGSRTAHDETRWEASLSWQPRHDTGYGVGVSSMSLDAVGSTTFVWVGVYPR